MVTKLSQVPHIPPIGIHVLHELWVIVIVNVIVVISLYCCCGFFFAESRDQQTTAATIYCRVSRYLLTLLIVIT